MSGSGNASLVIPSSGSGRESVLSILQPCVERAKTSVVERSVQGKSAQRIRPQFWVRAVQLITLLEQTNRERELGLDRRETG